MKYQILQIVALLSIFTVAETYPDVWRGGMDIYGYGNGYRNGYGYPDRTYGFRQFGSNDIINDGFRGYGQSRSFDGYRGYNQYNGYNGYRQNERFYNRFVKKNAESKADAAADAWNMYRGYNGYNNNGYYGHGYYWG